jgi:glycosyltransferase involved in cell wall biosynthesis
MESLAMGVPVIGTDIRGMRDLLASGGGKMVPVGDVEQLAGAIAHLLDHPEEAEHMARMGRAHVSAFDVAHVVSMHETLYRELLGVSGRHAHAALTPDAGSVV